MKNTLFTLVKKPLNVQRYQHTEQIKQTMKKTGAIQSVLQMSNFSHTA